MQELNPVGFPVKLITTGEPEVAEIVIAPEEVNKSQLAPAVPATFEISKVYFELVPNVHAPVDKIPTVEAALPGATVPDKLTVPFTVPLPPSVPDEPTVNELLALVMPFTKSAPAFTVVVPVYVCVTPEAKVEVPAPDCTTLIEPVPFAIGNVVTFTLPALLKVKSLTPAEPVETPPVILSVPEAT